MQSLEVQKRGVCGPAKWTYVLQKKLDHYQTCKPVIVSVVSSNPTGGNFIFLKHLNANFVQKWQKCQICVIYENLEWFNEFFSLSTTGCDFCPLMPILPFLPTLYQLWKLRLLVNANCSTTFNCRNYGLSECNNYANCTHRMMKYHSLIPPPAKNVR